MNSNLRSLIFACLFILAFLGACCSSVYTNPVADVYPLQELNLPSEIDQISDVVNPDIFDKHETNEAGSYLWGEWNAEETSDLSGVWSSFVIYSDAHTAQTWFVEECHAWGEPFEIGGDGNNMYCVSFQQQYRSPPDSFCTLTGNYATFVVFRKGDLIVHIEEHAASENSMRLSEAIEYLAEEIENHLSEQP
jgi:hypothetical protein